MNVFSSLEKKLLTALSLDMKYESEVFDFHIWFSGYLEAILTMSLSFLAAITSVISLRE